MSERKPFAQNRIVQDVRQGAYVTWIVMALCLLMFLLVQLNLPQRLNGSGDSSLTNSAILLGAYYKALISAGEWWRLLTVGLIHINLWHIVMNLFALYSLGPLVEKLYGHLSYAILLIISVILGSLVLYVVDTNSVTVGLSGGLYGLMSAEILFLARRGGLQNPAVQRSLLQTVLINFAINFLPGVAWQAHLGGALGGLICGVVFDPTAFTKSFRTNTLVAALVLVVGLGGLGWTRHAIPEDEQYYGTDLAYVTFVSKHGLKSYANHLSKSLDALYQTSLFETYLNQ